MMVNDKEKLYWVAVHNILGFQFCHHLSNLLQAYGTLENFWLTKDNINIGFIPKAIQEKLIFGRKTLEPQRLWQQILDKKIKVVTCKEKAFSKELLQIPLYPCILYYYGDLNLTNKLAVAIVGSRKASSYGILHSHNFAKALSAKNICVVSGMATGIDGAAHQGALLSEGGSIAVLGTGVDVPYPYDNIELYQQLCQDGLVLSEFPLGTQPRKWQFPQRNRIISGLAKLVLVIEAQARSGALITCDHALEQGKEICALPGPISNPGSIGPMRLIQQGAKLVITPNDVILEFEDRTNLKSTAPNLQLKFVDLINQEETSRNNIKLDKEEKEILSLLTYEPTHIDKLLSVPNLEVGKIYIKLASLKDKQLIDQLPGNYYLRT